ncbi:MAG: ABC transporter permease [Thermoflexales bacterium]
MSYALASLFEPGEERIQLLAVNKDHGHQAAAILRQLDALDAFQVETAWQGQPLTRAAAEQLIVDGQRNLAVIFPPNFSGALEQDLATAQPITARILLIADPAAPAQLTEPLLGTLQGLIERRLFTAMIPNGLDFVFAQLSPQTPAEQRQNFKAQAEQAVSNSLPGGYKPLVEVKRITPAGMRAERLPNTFQQNVPGYTIYGIFWIVSLLASSVLQERREGIFRRLLTASLSRAVMLIGKLTPYYLINLAQLAIMLGASSLLFGISLGYSPIELIVVSLIAAASATGLGVLIAAIAHTEAQVGGLTILLLLTMSALGGCFVPRFLMPEWLRTLGLLTPQAWALEAY